jgi:hypothetical protein
MFNVLRIIYSSQNKDVIGKWAAFPTKLHDVNIIKTHNRFNLKPFDFIFSTRRDLRDVAASLVRMGWCKNNTKSIIIKCRDIIKHHNFFSPSLDLEIPYEKMWNDKIECIEQIYSVLGESVDCEIISKKVDVIVAEALKANKKLDRDTQIHRNHITNGRPNSYFETLSKNTIAAIELEFSEWLNKFGYNKPLFL